MPVETRKQAVSYETMLLEKKRAVLAGLGVQFHKLDAVAVEDQAQVSHDQFISLHLNGLEYLQLRLIEEALDRLQTGDYGICISCEQPIPAKRLQAVPWARYCVPCQQRLDALHNGSSAIAVHPHPQADLSA